MPQVGQGQAHAQKQPQHPGPKHRQRPHVEDRLTHVHNLAAEDSHATIYNGGSFSDRIGLNTKDSLGDELPPRLAKQFYRQNTLNTPMNKPQWVDL